MSVLAPRAHAPEVTILCDDPECCLDGCPVVLCRACRNDWPCAHRRERDSQTVTARNQRWAQRNVEARSWG